MKVSVKALWLNGLRSGKYKQGQAALRRDNSVCGDRYCCLGVLCELAVEAGVIKPAQPSPNGGGQDGVYRYGSEGARSFLPIEVVHWAGLNSNPEVHASGGPTALASLNDQHMTFENIAKLIEDQL
jgi:hypothetical protein